MVCERRDSPREQLSFRDLLLYPVAGDFSTRVVWVRPLGARAAFLKPVFSHGRVFAVLSNGFCTNYLEEIRGIQTRRKPFLQNG